jgi:hypothetical protein
VGRYEISEERFIISGFDGSVHQAKMAGEILKTNRIGAVR